MTSLQSLEPLENYLQQHHRFIINDLAAATGLSVFDARIGTEQLMHQYRCRLQVTDKGEIIYDFGNLERRNEKTWQEVALEVLDWTGKVMKLLFRIWIAVTLVVYFIVFFVILLVIIIGIVASLFGGDGDSDGGGDFLGDVFSGLGDVFVAAFQWNTTVSHVHYTIDNQGYKYAEYDSVPSVRKKLKSKHDATLTPLVENPAEKGFIASIYDFIFGQPRVQLHSLAYQQEIAAFLRRKNGVLTLTEVKALNGLEGNAAEKLFSDCLVRFEGKPEVAEDGTLYADFEDFMTQVADQDHHVVYYWDEYEPDLKLTGNTTGRNVLITSLNAFNLIFGLLGLDGLYNELFEMPDATWLIWVLGYIPVAFSSLVFGIPVVRSVRNWFLRRRRHDHNIRKRVMKAIFMNYETDLTLEQFVQKINSAGQEEKLDQAIIEHLLNQLLHDLGGEIQINSEGNAVYAFTTVRRELQSIQTIRNQKGKRGNAGSIVFDTEQ